MGGAAMLMEISVSDMRAPYHNAVQIIDRSNARVVTFMTLMTTLSPFRTSSQDISTVRWAMGLWSMKKAIINGVLSQS
jgi:hypothetical protein